MWNDFGEKQFLITRLEAIASSVERGFPRRLRSGDISTAAVLSNQFTEMAAAFRDFEILDRLAS
jgi:hypothetical protein